MPRKSNKTAHVLNLLSGDDTAQEESPIQSKDSAKEDNTSELPIIELSAGNEDPISDLIKATLESEALDLVADSEQSLNTPESGLNSSISFPETHQPEAAPEELRIAEPPQTDTSSMDAPVVKTPVIDASVTETSGIGAPNVETPDMDAPIAETPNMDAFDAEAPATDLPIDKVPLAKDPITETQTEVVPAGQTATVEATNHDKLPENTEESQETNAEPEVRPAYQIVNVMESIVRDKVQDFMKEFNMCLCERCVTDTIALCLSSLPAKYIVVDQQAVSPLLNFYSNKYIGQVVVELTKSCITVRENPRH